MHLHNRHCSLIKARHRAQHTAKNAAKNATRRSVWLLLCVGFILMSTWVPVHATYKSLLFISVDEATDEVPIKTAHHAPPNQLHHSESGIDIDVECLDSACFVISDCNEDCSISSCCITSSVTPVFLTLLIYNKRIESVQQPINTPAFFSWPKDPLFKPPIS